MDATQSRTGSAGALPLPRAAPADVPDIAALYAQYASFVWRVLRGMGVGPAAVPDAVQDVFVVVHRRYPEFDHRAKVRTWLFEIAYRVGRDYRRKQAKAHALVEASEELPAATRSPAEHLEHRERMELMHRALDRLDEAKRMVLVLAEIEGMTAPEIAELTGVPLNTVYTRLRRARIEFSAALGKGP
ncbi:MAG TPA: sigma-70 family RNA polymerase sigma factor [Polyangiales bacterium]|nr:sigma-70 family RNA polymerase sigma factor [Polyangiales bacterium]